MKTCSKCSLEKESVEFYKGVAQCKVCVKKRVRARYDDKKDEILEYHKDYNTQNKEKIRNQRKDYYENNKESIRERERQRKKEDPIFRLSCTLRKRMGNAIKKGYGKKASKTQELLGCEFETVKKHLEERFQEGMSWDNHGKWHIDHIIPCDSFDLSDPKQQEKCFHYTNLQPLWEKDNWMKSNKISEEWGNVEENA